MGIKNLLHFLRDVAVKVRVSSLECHVAAVDASCWLHKAIALSYKQCGDDRRVLTILELYINLLRRNNIGIIVVFDGLSLKAKESERAKRARIRLANRKRAEFLRQNGNEAEANKVLAAAIEIDFSLTLKFINLCRQMSLRYIVAPYEADAQIVFLVQNGYADFAISEDSDLLAYGCSKVLYKLQLTGLGDLFIMTSVLEFIEMDQWSFLCMCIASGCDYLPNVKGVGVSTAKKVIKENQNFLQFFANLPHAPQDYCEQFVSTRAIFKHQTIFDPDKLTTAPLTGWNKENSELCEKLKDYCGSLLPQEYAVALALGNVNPMDKDIVANRYPIPSQGKLWQSQEMFLIINALEAECIKWNVPCFSVLDIMFKRGVATVRGITQPVLFNPEEMVEIRDGDKVYCSKSCYITLEQTKYLVVWKFGKVPTTTPCQISHEHQTNGDNSEHTLPFKVLGVSYKNRQTHLKIASEKIKNNEDVHVMIKAEPENENDKYAIAVLIDYGEGWKTVGYIAKELTYYLHPHLQSDRIHVTIAHIRFRVTYLLVGYYLTLNITQKGQWPTQVMNASKSVK